ncbi:MAG TPA: hypothetical protein VGM73_11880 [Candidatus Didemnitutus sp.]
MPIIQDKTTIFAVVAGYLLVLIVIGIVFRRFSKDTNDYFRASGKVTWWLLGGSMFMQSFSAWTFTGAAGAAFEAGFSLTAMQLSNVLVFVSFALVTGPWFRQLRCITGADVVRLRFGPGMEQVIAYLGMVMGPIYGGVQLYGLAIFTSVLLGVPIAPTIVLLGVVVLFYAALSGAWAVLAADFIKGLILIPISVLLGVVCLQQVGGLEGLLAAIRHAGLSAAFAPVKSAAVMATLDGVDHSWFTPAFFAAWYANNLVNSNSLNGASCPRFLCAKDGREARRAAWFAGVLLLGGAFIWYIPPMTARLLIPDQVAAMPLAKPVEGAYAAMAIRLLPPGLVGVVLVGMCASTMSTLDTGLTSLAANITENIYPAICRLLGVLPWQGRPRLIFAKFVNVFCAVVIIGSALIMSVFGQGGIFKILLDVLATVVPPVALPMLYGLFVRRVAPIVPFVSIGCGLGASLSIIVLPAVYDLERWTFQAQVGAVLAVTTACFFIVRRLCPPDRATLAREEEFFARRDRPVDFELEIGAANDSRQLVIIGAFSLVLGLGILLLLIPESSRGHAWEINAVAAVVIAVGALMLWQGRRRGAREHGDRT